MTSLQEKVWERVLGQVLAWALDVLRHCCGDHGHGYHPPFVLVLLGPQGHHGQPTGRSPEPESEPELGHDQGSTKYPPSVLPKSKTDSR